MTALMFQGKIKHTAKAINLSWQQYKIKTRKYAQFLIYFHNNRLSHNSLFALLKKSYFSDSIYREWRQP